MDCANVSKELCIICQIQPYDLICTCGDKFDFTCIHSHVEQLGIEFEFIQNEVGQRLLNIEQIVDDIDSSSGKAIIENWKQKRLQDINDIAELALNEIVQREKAYFEVAPLRVNYNSLCEGSHRVVHEQLDSMIAFQRRILEKSEEIQNLPEPIRNDFNLDLQLKMKLNPLVFQENEIQIKSNQTNTSEESIRSINIPNKFEDNISISDNPTSENSIDDRLPVIDRPESPQSIDNNHLTSATHVDDQIPRSSTESPPIDTAPDDDDIDAGRTTCILRRHPIILPANNDRSLATICCHETQLIYNDNTAENQRPRLTFLKDFTQIHNKQFIDLTTCGDDPWIQDIAYSNKLQAYLLLSRTCLRILSANTLTLDEFCSFPDRSMKRVTCTDRFIYLVSADSHTGQQGDEIVLFDYDKNEIIWKTSRDVFAQRAYRTSARLTGEISDIAVNQSEEMMFTYRLERRQEVGVYLYKISSDGQDWHLIKQLLLNDCWRNELSYTPRVEWCEKLCTFVLIEYITGHLIMIDEIGQVKGETQFNSIRNRTESPLNLNISNNDYLCVRYETSINIYRLDEDRV